MNRIILTFLSIFILFFCIPGAGSADMEQGQWEFTLEIEMVGMPMKMPPSTYKQCITDDDPVPQNSQPGEQCTVKNMKRKGDTITWDIVCDTGAGKSTGTGEVRYQGKKMTGSMKMQTQGMTMVTKMKGHWIGPCQ